jgi:hypothetical protein
MKMSPFSGHFSGAPKKREAAAPKPSDCISGEDFLGGDGRAEDTKVRGAGIWLEAVPEKMSGRKRTAY